MTTNPDNFLGTNKLEVKILSTKHHDKIVGANYFVVVKLLMATDDAFSKPSLVDELRTDIANNVASGEPSFFKNKLPFKDFSVIRPIFSMLDFEVFISPHDLAKVGLTAKEDELTIEDLKKHSIHVGTS